MFARGFTFIHIHILNKSITDLDFFTLVKLKVHAAKMLLSFILKLYVYLIQLSGIKSNNLQVEIFSTTIKPV